MNPKHFRRLVLALAGGAGFMVWTVGAGPPSECTVRPRYSPDGRLEYPSGFRRWVFAGANLSPRYKGEGDGKADAARKSETPAEQELKEGEFHNIYITPDAYRSFLETGQFPDPTMLVLEVFRAERRDPKGVLTGGQFEAQRVGLSVAVKDRQRPGGGVPWAYYSFQFSEPFKRPKPAPAQADAACFACHLEHASKDNVWVQFYPALRDPE